MDEDIATHGRTVPGRAWRAQPPVAAGAVEPGLVAEPAEPQDSAPALRPVQPDGRGVRLRRGVQEARPRGREARTSTR